MSFTRGISNNKTKHRIYINRKDSYLVTVMWLALVSGSDYTTIRFFSRLRHALLTHIHKTVPLFFNHTVLVQLSWHLFTWSYFYLLLLPHFQCGSLRLFLMILHLRIIWAHVVKPVAKTLRLGCTSKDHFLNLIKV